MGEDSFNKAFKKLNKILLLDSSTNNFLNPKSVNGLIYFVIQKNFHKGIYFFIIFLFEFEFVGMNGYLG